MSPKKTLKPIKEVQDLANELKVIISNKNDFKWAQLQSKKVKKSCKLFLQPEWSKKQEILPEIVNFVSNNIQWSISLQTHKYMNLP